jgi:heme-degrading monooxygenase HmoA
MFACIIEYTVRDGRMQEHDAALMPLLEKVASAPGFISKEYFTNPDGRLLTISYWTDREALAAWVADPDHRKAMVVGKAEIFSWFCIRVAEVERDYSWTYTPPE